MASKRTGKTLQERTNLPFNAKLESTGSIKPARDANLHQAPKLMNTTNDIDARHFHQRSGLSGNLNLAPSVIMLAQPTSTTPTPSSSGTLPQIQLLQAAINLLKAHAKDAGSNIEQLRVLLANRDTEPATYQSLQQQRLLQERRELDAHRALWSTAQKVSAILKDDEESFELQRRSDQSLGLFNTSYRPPLIPSATPEAQSRLRKHRRLVSLTLASKVDFTPRSPKPATASEPFPPTIPSELQPEPEPQPMFSIPSRPTPRPRYVSVAKKAGTAAIYRHTANPDREGLAQRIKDVEVAMPDYVGDLLLEFDSLSNAPPLELTSPPPSPKKKKVSSWMPHASPLPTSPKAEPAALSHTSLDLPRNQIKHKTSRNRFSDIFVSSSKKHTSTTTLTPPTLDELSFPQESLTSPHLPAPASATSPASTLFSPVSVMSPVPRSGNSLSAVPEDQNAKRFSATSVLSLVSSVNEPRASTESQAKESNGITSRLRKRMSKLRG